VHGSVPPAVIGVAISHPPAELIGIGSQQRVVMHFVVAARALVLLPTVVHRHGAVDDGAHARIVIRLPLESDAADRAGAKRGNHRRSAARPYQEGIAGYIRGALEYVALPG